MSLPPSALAPPSRANAFLAVAWGVMVTLAITGYTFGQSNHHVYLLDALRLTQPETLARDWFTNNTLQYHFLFTWLVIGLQKIGLLEAGFFVFYLALVVAMHAAWLAIVRQVGGDLAVYMLSVLIYHLSGGGLGLGVYQFLQDGSFLPSNVSSVATLVAVALWLNGRLIGAAVAVGVAGLFHVNYAVLLVGAWGLLSAWSWWREARAPVGRYLFATLLAMPPCLYNVGVAAVEAMRHSADIPLDEFVALYVRLRHEHHHDPLHWPLALWISWLWPIPVALVALRRLPDTPARRRLDVLLFLTLGIVVFAFTFAGLWFVSGSIVKLSLFRFSIFPKLITCVYAAWFFLQLGRRGRTAIDAVCIVVAGGLLVLIGFRSALPTSIPAPQLGLLIGGSMLTGAFVAASRWRVPTGLRVAFVAVALPACVFFAGRQRLGVEMPGENDPDMLAVCDWARRETAPSALFLTPAHDSIFSLAAERSTVVGFKQVPQLSAEIIEWRRRLCDVLDMDILALPTPMPRTLDAMAKRYTALPPEHLLDVARRYDCDYLVAMRPLPGAVRPAFVAPGGRYVVYRVSTLDNAGRPTTLTTRESS